MSVRKIFIRTMIMRKRTNPKFRRDFAEKTPTDTKPTSATLPTQLVRRLSGDFLCTVPPPQLEDRQRQALTHLRAIEPRLDLSTIAFGRIYAFIFEERPDGEQSLLKLSETSSFPNISRHQLHRSIDSSELGADKIEATLEQDRIARNTVLGLNYVVQQMNLLSNEHNSHFGYGLIVTRHGYDHTPEGHKYMMHIESNQSTTAPILRQRLLAMTHYLNMPSSLPTVQWSDAQLTGVDLMTEVRRSCGELRTQNLSQQGWSR